MISHTKRTTLSASLAICLVYGAVASAQSIPEMDYLLAVTGMVTEQAQRSAHDAALMREFYTPYIEPLALDDYAQIQEGLATGGIVPLPRDPRFNIRVRLEGSNPIGEKDIVHQLSYVAARPATIGCLMDVASRVKSGPIEVTSLVRHLEYQQQLRTTNLNATTDVPTHALGLAFDIAMVNTPLPTVLEIRDVLQRMSDAGDILVIVERQQLVFHVVPQPSRLGWYADVYANAIAGRPWGRRTAARGFTPVVTAEIGSLRPLAAWSEAWWAADNVPVDLPMEAPTPMDGDAGSHEPAAPVRRGMMARYFSFFGDLFSATWPRLTAVMSAKT